MPRRLLNQSLALVLFSWALVPAAWGQSDQPPLKVYDQVLHATAWIIVPRDRAVASGTAWVVDRPSKLLVTNYHVVRDADTVTVIFPAYRDGKLITERSYYLKSADKHRGRVIARAPRRDLALIEVDSLPDEVVALKLAADSAGPGDRVHTVGNPGASEGLWGYTSGTVRQVYHKRFMAGKEGAAKFEIDARVVETQTPTNPGDSGGPLVNDKGELVAVNSSHLEAARLVSLCIDVTEVKELLASARSTALPRTALDFYRRGLAEAKKRNLEQAVRDFSEAVRLDPKHAPSYAYRAAALVSLEKYDQAIADATTAIQLDAKQAPAYSNRGIAYGYKKEYDKALADLTEALRLNPKNAAAHFNRGVILYEKGQYDQAIADLTAALQGNPGSAKAHLWRSKAYAKKGEEAKAAADRQEALRLDPKIK